MIAYNEQTGGKKWNILDLDLDFFDYFCFANCWKYNNNSTHLNLPYNLFRMHANTFILRATVKIWALKKVQMTTFQISLGSRGLWRLSCCCGCQTSASVCVAPLMLQFVLSCTVLVPVKRVISKGLCVLVMSKCWEILVPKSKVLKSQLWMLMFIFTERRQAEIRAEHIYFSQKLQIYCRNTFSVILCTADTSVLGGKHTDTNTVGNILKISNHIQRFCWIWRKINSFLFKLNMLQI